MNESPEQPAHEQSGTSENDEVRRRRAIRERGEKLGLKDVNPESDDEGSALGTAYLRSTSELVTGEPEPTDFSDVASMEFTEKHHDNKNELLSSYLTILLKDKVVLDLGCGKLGTGYHIARFVKAKRYIGVEKYNALSAFAATAKIESAGVPFEIVQDDIREYVKDRSHTADVVFLVGIDEANLSSGWPDLLEQIYFRLPEDGRLIMAGGWSKPWDWIDRYFEKDRESEEVLKMVSRDATVSSFAKMFLPDVYKKKPGVESWRSGSL